MEEKVYQRNFISEVILRVDFNKSIALTSENLRTFKDALKYEVEYKEESVTKYEMKFEKDNQSFNIVNIGKLGSYLLKSHNAKFIFDHEKFLLTTNKYVRFSAFYDLFKTGVLIMQGVIDINEFKRIGLRYINTIELDELKALSDWREFINADFIPDYSKIRIDASNFSLRRNMNTFIFKDGEYAVNVNLGLWNREFPSIISNDKSVILDIDCYIDNVLLNKEDILSKPDNMNKVALLYFESLITDKLRKIMGAR